MLATIFSGLGPLPQGLVYFIFHYSNKCSKAGGFITKGRELIKGKTQWSTAALPIRRETNKIGLVNNNSGASRCDDGDGAR
jgi:hypothetical protein